MSYNITHIYPEGPCTILVGGWSGSVWGSGTIFGQGRGGGRYQRWYSVGRGSGRPRVRIGSWVELSAWVVLRVVKLRVPARVSVSTLAPWSGPWSHPWVRPIDRPGDPGSPSRSHPFSLDFSDPAENARLQIFSKIFQILNFSWNFHQ